WVPLPTVFRLGPHPQFGPQRPIGCGPEHPRHFRSALEFLEGSPTLPPTSFLGSPTHVFRLGSQPQSVATGRGHRFFLTLSSDLSSWRAPPLAPRSGWGPPLVPWRMMQRQLAARAGGWLEGFCG